MKFPNLTKVVTLLMLTISVFFLVECSATKTASSGSGDDLSDLGSFKIEKTGVTLWGEHCSRCHLAPDPSAFSDVQWEAIGTHMRIRAGITAEEAQKIILFLQQGN